MPQTDTGVLLLVGTIFLLIGLLGGGIEIAAAKIPSVGKYPRIFSTGIGVILMGIALSRLIFPTLPPQQATLPTDVSTSIPVAPTETLIPPTHTLVPPTDIPPTPVPTLTPVPSPTSAVEDSTVKFSEEFDGSSGFDTYGDIAYTNNSVEVSQGGGITLLSGLSERTGMVFLLKSTTGEFNCVLTDMNSSRNYYIGVKTNSGYDLITSIGQDNQFIGGSTLEGNLSFSPDRWYFVMVEILKDGTFYIRVWEKTNPLNYGEKKLRLGSKWEEQQQWYPQIYVTTGKVTVDYYQELEFK